MDPLFKDWRSACASWPFDHDEHQTFVFDINLPQSTNSNEARIEWAHSRLRGFYVVEEHVTRFIQGIATVMRIRSRGKARFEITGVEAYRKASPSDRSDGYFRNIQQVLLELSRPE